MDSDTELQYLQADAVEKPVSWGGYEAKRDVAKVGALSARCVLILNRSVYRPTRSRNQFPGVGMRPSAMSPKYVLCRPDVFSY